MMVDTVRRDLFGVEVDALDMDDTVDRIMTLIDERVQVQHVVLNASKVVMMSNDAKLRAVIRACPVVNADGQSVVIASRLLRRPLPERVAGIDLFVELVKRSAENGRSVYFLGARDDVVEEMVSRFRTQYPSLRVAGFRNGYWTNDAEVVGQVHAAQPDLLFVAIPSPRKEFWLAEHLPALGVPFAMGVGGSFDVLAGKVKRAPKWVQRIGCEWVYRLVQEPRRMWKRYLVGNTAFMWLTIKELWRSR